ncbi:E3 ubiquitin-protein ligase HECTD3-like, partial [Actinia tenebrosa]|uniref:E3 ubiquitin-protein ligase HECTD3-like n=1 Tax=Actinia tenebrosa TaxID=6105 RepID=A0A6P8HUC5_ACTTE
DNVGDYQDSYIPNPSCKQWAVYEWLGKLFGAVYRSDENLTLTCPPLFWKLLIGAHVTWAKDFAAVDDAAVRFTDELELVDEELYLATYGNECKFSTVLSDGTRVDLIPHGETKGVMTCDRTRFAFLLREARMTESVKQVLAIRKGLVSCIPESVMMLLTWNELERGVCGNPVVSLDVLKGACKYGDDLSESAECVKHLWT